MKCFNISRGKLSFTIDPQVNDNNVYDIFMWLYFWNRRIIAPVLYNKLRNHME